MRENPVKRTLAAGGVAIGTMVFEFASSGVARIAAEAGAEFVVFDMEHTGWSIETIRTLMATAGGANMVPAVRAPATAYHLLSRPLDVGAMGLMVPMVESEAQAREIVRAAKYPPLGGRGAAFGIAHDDYAGGDVAAKMEAANREGLVFAQVETAQGIEAAAAIAAVEGVDLLWIGQFDLSVSLGVPAQFEHPTFLRAVDRVLEACARHGKTPGMMVTDVASGQALLAQGFRCLAYSGDLWIYGEALRRGIAGLREGVPAAATGPPA